MIWITIPAIYKYSCWVWHIYIYNYPFKLMTALN